MTVILRPYREHDVPRIVEACADAETSYWLGTLPVPYTAEHARNVVIAGQEQAASGEATHWAVVDPVEDVLLGSVSLLDQRSGSGPEVGYWTHPQARGRGLTTLAVRLLVDRALTARPAGGLGFGKLRLESAAANTASRRVAEKVGFREVGTASAAIICRDGMHDAIRYVLLVTDLRDDPRKGKASRTDPGRPT